MNGYEEAETGSPISEHFFKLLPTRCKTCYNKKSKYHLQRPVETACVAPACRSVIGCCVANAL